MVRSPSTVSRSDTRSSFTQLSYTVKHSSAGRQLDHLAVPEDLPDQRQDVIFDATKCATVVPAEDVLNTYEVVGAGVRYGDDSCDGVTPDQQTWAAVVEAHGSEVVSSIKVTTGFTGGDTLSALLRSIKVNGTEYVFGAA